MVKRKWVHITMLSVLAGLMMTSFQNCAPPGKLGAAGVESDQVGVINPVTTKGAVSFIEEDVAVQSPAQSAAISGVCRADQIGATLSWVLRDANGNEIADGNADCEESGFEVELAPTLASLSCGGNYQLYARLGVDESEPVSINHDCQ